MPSCRPINIIRTHSPRQADTLITVLGNKKLHKVGQNRLMTCSKFLLQGHMEAETLSKKATRCGDLWQQEETGSALHLFRASIAVQQPVTPAVQNLPSPLLSPQRTSAFRTSKLPRLLLGSVPWNTGLWIWRSSVCYSSWQQSFHPLGK